MRDSLIKTIDEILRSEKNFTDKISASLELIGKSFKTDRAYIFENTFKDSRVLNYASQRFEWTEEGITVEIDNPEMQDIPFHRFPDVFTLLWEDKAYHSLTINTSEEMKELLDAQNIKSLLLLPIYLEKDKFWGFMGMDECKYNRQFSEEEVELFREVSEMMKEDLFKR